MAIDPSSLPTYVLSSLPDTCFYCGAALTTNQIDWFRSDIEEVTKGDTPYHCSIVEFHCVCSACIVNRYIDWQRTEYP